MRHKHINQRQHAIDTYRPVRSPMQVEAVKAVKSKSHVYCIKFASNHLIIRKNYALYCA